MTKKILLFAVLLVISLSSIEGSILARLFGSQVAQATQPQTAPGYPAQNFQNFLTGDWIVEKLIKSNEANLAEAEPVFDRFNLTIRATNVSAHYDLETVEGEGKAPSFKIRTDGAWNGVFMVVDETAAKKQKTVHVGEIPEEEEFVSEIDPSTLKEVFRYNFSPRANGFLISYGTWEATTEAEKSRTYTFLVSSPISFLLSIADTDHLVEFTAKKLPSTEVLPWYKTFGSSGMMIGFFVLMQVLKRFMGPKIPEQSPGVPSPKASPSTKAAKSKKAQ